MAKSAGAAFGGQTLVPLVGAGRACQAAVLAGEPATAPPSFFNLEQLRTLDALAEAIIPADDHSPGARATRVPLFIDTVVAGSDEIKKKFWTSGLAAIDKMAGTVSGKNFVDCNTEEQAALLGKLSAHEDHPGTPEERFFVALKRATIDGYYTSEISIHQELEYQGNTALGEFEGCTHKRHAKDP